MSRCRRKQGSGAQEREQGWRETQKSSAQSNSKQIQMRTIQGEYTESLGQNAELDGQSTGSPERRLRRSHWNAKKKNKRVQYFRALGKKGREKGGQQCVKFSRENRLRHEKCLGFHYKDLHSGIGKSRVSQQVWVEPDCKMLGLKEEVRNRC